MHNFDKINIEQTIDFLNQLFSVVAFAIEPIAQVSVFPVVENDKLIDFEFSFDWHRQLRCTSSNVCTKELLSDSTHIENAFKSAFLANKVIESKIFPFLNNHITPLLEAVKDVINQNNLISNYPNDIPFVCGLMMDPRLPSFEPQIDAIETAIIEMGNNDELSNTFERFCDLLHDIDSNHFPLPKEVLVHVDKGQSFHEQELLSTLLTKPDVPLINKNFQLKNLNQASASESTHNNKKPKML